MPAALKPPMSPLGIVSDDAQYGAILGDWLEHVTDMVWPASIPILVRMSKDAQIGASLAGYTRPVQRATWNLDPAGCRAEVVQFVADDMGLPVAGKDKAGAARVRGVSWRDHLNGSLEKLKFGHAGFEILAEMRDGKAHLAALPERMPSTIAEIHIDRNGAFAGISQNLIGRAGKAPQIPAERMVWHTHERRGASWQGTPLIRNSYSSWLLKVELQRVLATSSRRFGMGVPNIEWAMGANPTPQQHAEAHNLASAARVGDVAGASLPPGARLVLTGLSGGIPDTLGFIKWLDQQVSRSMLAGWLDLGETSNGSRALGESFVDFFLMSLQSIAEDVAEVATRQIAARIVEWNWGPDEPVPAVRCADVGSRREVTAESLQLLLSSGALGADPGLEEYVRREWRLPERKVVEEAPKSPPKPDSDEEPAGGEAPGEPADAGSDPDPDEVKASEQLLLDFVEAARRFDESMVKRDRSGKFARKSSGDIPPAGKRSGPSKAAPARSGGSAVRYRKAAGGRSDVMVGDESVGTVGKAESPALKSRPWTFRKADGSESEGFRTRKEAAAALLADKAEEAEQADDPGHGKVSPPAVLPDGVTVDDDGYGDFVVTRDGAVIGGVSANGDGSFSAVGASGAQIPGSHPTREGAAAAALRSAGYEPRLAAALASGIVEDKKTATGLVAQTSRVKFGDGTKAIRKISGDVTSDLSPGQVSLSAKAQVDAEVLASRFGQALGVPAPGVHRVSDTEIVMELAGSASAWSRVFKGSGKNSGEKLDPWVNSRQGILLGLMDTVMGNYDRHAENWRVDKDGTIRPIDHGLAWNTRKGVTTPDEFGYALAATNPFAAHFGEEAVVRGAFGAQWKNNPLHPDDVPVLRAKLEGLRADFDAAGRSDWLDDAMVRVDVIARYATGSERLLGE